MHNIDNLTKNETHEKLKETLRELLSSKIKRNPEDSSEDFITKLKERALPIVNDLDGAKLDEFAGNVNHISSLIPEDIIKKLTQETGISISLSKDSPNYKEVEKALLEVLTEMQAIKVSGD